MVLELPGRLRLSIDRLDVDLAGTQDTGMQVCSPASLDELD